jgi:hypothetical protein
MRLAQAINAQKIAAVAPPGWEDTVKKMKDHPEIDNPWALAWYEKNKGDTPGGKDMKAGGPGSGRHPGFGDGKKLVDYHRKMEAHHLGQMYPSGGERQASHLYKEHEKAFSAHARALDSLGSGKNVSNTSQQLSTKAVGKSEAADDASAKWKANLSSAANGKGDEEEPAPKPQPSSRPGTKQDAVKRWLKHSDLAEQSTGAAQQAHDKAAAHYDKASTAYSSGDTEKGDRHMFNGDRFAYLGRSLDPAAAQAQAKKKVKASADSGFYNLVSVEDIAAATEHKRMAKHLVTMHNGDKVEAKRHASSASRSAKRKGDSRLQNYWNSVNRHIKAMSDVEAASLAAKVETPTEQLKEKSQVPNKKGVLTDMTDAPNPFKKKGGKEKDMEAKTVKAEPYNVEPNKFVNAAAAGIGGNMAQTIAQLEIAAGGPGSGRKPGGKKPKFIGNKEAGNDLHKELVSKGFSYKRSYSANEGRAQNHNYQHEDGRKASIYDHSGGMTTLH